MDLQIGAVYHWLAYDDEKLSRPMIMSVEYLGLDVFERPAASEESRYCFRIVGTTNDNLVFVRKNLPNLVDVPGLIGELQEFQAGRLKLPPGGRTKKAAPEAKGFFTLAKDAGNKLRAYILSYSSAATGVFFLALTGKDLQIYNPVQKGLLLVALLLYVATALLCLLELRIDARRLYHIGEHIEQGGGFRENHKTNKLRLRLIYASYITASLATAAMVAFLFLRVL